MGPSTASTTHSNCQTPCPQGGAHLGVSFVTSRIPSCASDLVTFNESGDADGHVQYNTAKLALTQQWNVQVSDEDDATIAMALADKLEAAIATELVLPEKHGLIPNQNNLIQTEIE